DASEGALRAGSLPTMPRPLIGLCAALERAHYGPWDVEATLLPRSYARAVHAAGGLPVVLPPVRLDDASDLLDRLDALVLARGAGGGRGADHGQEPPPPGGGRARRGPRGNRLVGAGRRDRGDRDAGSPVRAGCSLAPGGGRHRSRHRGAGRGRGPLGPDALA